MAFLAPQQDQDKDKDQQGQQADAAGQAGPVLGAPSAAPIAGASGAPAAPGGAAPKATRSGSWTNLSNYIGANKGAGEQMAGAVGGKVQGAATDAQTAGKTLQDAGTKQAQAATISDQGVNAELGKVAQGQAANLNGTQLNKQLNATYAGPNDYTQVKDADIAGTVGKYGKVQNYGEAAAGGQGGRAYLADETFGQSEGGNRYRGGERNLDAFMMGAEQGGADKLGGLNQQYGKFVDDEQQGFGAIRNAIKSAADQGRTTTDATRTATQSARDTAIGSLDNRFREAAGKATKANQDRAIAGMNYKGAGLSDAALKRLTADGTGFDMTRLMNAGKDFSAADYAKDADVNNYNQLYDMLGLSKNTNYAQRAGGQAASANHDIINAANSLTNYESQARQQAAAKNDARHQNFNTAKAAITAAQQNGNYGAFRDNALKFGISPEDVDFAWQYGVDPTAGMTYGGDMAEGQTLSDYGRTDYQRIANMLGLKPTLDVAARGPASEFAFDGNDFGGRLQAIRDDLAKGKGDYWAQRKRDLARGFQSASNSDLGQAANVYQQVADPVSTATRKLFGR